MSRSHAAAAAGWLGSCLLGGWLLLSYAAAPGRAATAPAHWPESALPRAPGRSSLVLFAHPHCPCTRATLDNLAWVLTRAGRGVDARVLVYAPSGMPAGWERAALWRQAESIPGVRVSADRDGALARTFGAATSGQALLYGEDGRLLYRGGLTGARGHAGDNAGRQAVLALARGEGAPRDEGPVFGCALLRAGDDAGKIHGG